MRNKVTQRYKNKVAPTGTQLSQVPKQTLLNPAQYIYTTYVLYIKICSVYTSKIEYRESLREFRMCEVLLPKRFSYPFGKFLVKTPKSCQKNDTERWLAQQKHNDYFFYKMMQQK